MALGHAMRAEKFETDRREAAVAERPDEDAGRDLTRHGLAHARKLFQRQLAKATLKSGAVDLDALADMVAATYEEADRDRRRTDRSIGLMVEEVEQAHAQLVEAFDIVPEGLVQLDPKGRYVRWNRKFAELYDTALDKITVGASFADSIRAGVERGHYLDAVGREDAWLADRLAQNDRYKSSCEQHIAGDRWVRIDERRTPDGGSIGVRIDITDLKRREESFRLLFDENPIPMWVVDQQSLKFLAVNNAAVSHYGYSRDQFMEMTPFDIRPAEEREEFRHFVLRGDWTQGGASWRHLKQDGSTILVTAYSRSISHEGRAAWLSAIIDITERNRAEERIRYMAHHDLLTGLPNRALFLERTENAGARLRQRGDRFAVFMLDLDRFKDVNDSLGHPAGDALLKDTARRLKAVLNEAEVLARLGGDEFAILQPIGDDGGEEAAELARRVLRAISVPYDIDGSKIVVGTSIGIALAPLNGVEPSELMKQADLALYRQKAAGRDGYRFFDAGMTMDADARHQLMNDLRHAISNNELEIHYQRFVDVKTGVPHGAEALLRWSHPRRGDIPPAEFVKLAEESGLIAPLGDWVLQRACADAASWPSHIKLAVNLSPAQFKKGNLLDVVMCALVESGLPPERLELEITESLLIESHMDVVPVIRQLRNLGISIALDDFGTGYSSLSYVTMFPFEKIKIDQSFVKNLMKRTECKAIISSVLALGRGLDIAITAEGVETQAQFDLLSSYGVDSIQGFLFGRPCPASQLDFDRIGPEQSAASAPQRATRYLQVAEARS
jgi:diguanylate cyclase (GGDEF)-like protein/PAS domain S-box-containing protein